jgi:hypothetical protein
MRLGGKPHVPANSCAEHRTGADRQQRPLVPRSRSWRRLTAGVDMTSAVKSCEPLFQVFMMLFNLRALQEAEPVRYDG